MALVDRARNMIVQPAAEWPVVAMEPATPAGIYTGYVIPLALIGPVCSFITLAVFLHHPIIGLVSAVLAFVLELVYVYLVALIAKALVPSFNGAADQISALKWVTYAYTARWVAGIFQLIPVLGGLLVLLGSLYSLYVLYLGAGPVMRVPPDKSVGFVVVLVLITIVIGIIVGIIIGTAVAFVTLSTAGGAALLGH